MSQSISEAGQNPATSLAEAKEQSSTAEQSASNMDNTTAKPDPSPRELELQRLEKAYQTAQLERRTLLRQLQEMLNQDSSSSSTTLIASDGLAPSSEGQMTMPSTRAHSSPVPPMTPAEETAISTAAQGVIKEHIKLLSRYNEIRDIGQGLIGMVAENRKVRIRDCQEEFGVTEGD